MCYLVHIFGKFLTAERVYCGFRVCVYSLMQLCAGSLYPALKIRSVILGILGKTPASSRRCSERYYDMGKSFCMFCLRYNLWRRPFFVLKEARTCNFRKEVPCSSLGIRKVFVTYEEVPCSSLGLF